MSTNATIEKFEAKAGANQCEGSYVPAVDIVESKDEFLLRAEVPGATADGVNIDYERGRLTIHARVPERQMAENTRYLVREYGVGDYCRSFEIGEGVDADRIRAELADGILTLHLPKADKLRPRRIEVKATG